MSEVKDFIESGILEMYVLEQTSADETRKVQQMAEKYEEVKNEIREISLALERYALSQAIEPDPMIKPFLLATIDYTERLKKGEQPSFPPALHPGSKIADYNEWLTRADLQLTQPLDDAHAIIIGYTPKCTTAIVWLKYGAPPETHTKEYEIFLIVEGTCDITIGTEVHHLKAGDYLSIPLHISHNVQVTSQEACKVILERMAA